MVGRGTRIDRSRSTTISTPAPTQRDALPNNPKELLGQVVFSAWRTKRVIEHGAARWVLGVQTGEAETEMVLIAVRPFLDQDITAELADLNRQTTAETPNLIPMLQHGTLGDGTQVLVLQVPEYESLSSRLERQAPDLGTVLLWLADVARGLHALHGQQRAFGRLAPQNVALVPGPNGGVVAALPPTWWCGDTGFNVSATQPWASPDPGGHPSARDGWSLGAMLWHALTGSPPTDLPNPSEWTSRLPRGTPPGVDALLHQLLVQPLPTGAIDLSVIADAIDTIARRVANGSEPAIAPPMLLGTPVPVRGQLRASGHAMPPPNPSRPLKVPLPIAANRAAADAAPSVNVHPIVIIVGGALLGLAILASLVLSGAIG